MAFPPLLRRCVVVQELASQGRARTPLANRLGGACDSGSILLLGEYRTPLCEAQDGHFSRKRTQRKCLRCNRLDLTGVDKHIARRAPDIERRFLEPRINRP